MDPMSNQEFDGDIVVLDIGTGSIRAALVAPSGEIFGLNSRSYETMHPQHGWVEQRPSDWWKLTIEVVAEAMRHANSKRRKPVAICCCGHMHAPVLIDQRGELVSPTVPLWNDKRAHLQALKLADNAKAHKVSANPATPAWPGVKLRWMQENHPDLISPKHTLLMTKDYINFRLCGTRAMDVTEASSSMMFDASSHTWSPYLMELLDLPMELLPELFEPTQVIGSIHSAAADATGLPIGLPVIAGMGDYPAALAGSGADPTSEACDITGTASLITCFGQAPIIDANVMNIATAGGNWGAFTMVDAAGDSIRWAKQQINGDQDSFADITQAVLNTQPCADGLFFMPYLTGERMGQGQNSRGALLGLTAGHSTAHIYRAIMEGVGFALRQAAEPIFNSRPNVSAIVAAAGGAKDVEWLQIKADIFDLPIHPTEESEAGLLGGAAAARVGLGQHYSLNAAVRTMVKRKEPILPNAANVQIYNDAYDVFCTARQSLEQINEAIAENLG